MIWLIKVTSQSWMVVYHPKITNHQWFLNPPHWCWTLLFLEVCRFVVIQYCKQEKNTLKKRTINSKPWFFMHTQFCYHINVLFNRLNSQIYTTKEHGFQRSKKRSWEDVFSSLYDRHTIFHIYTHIPHFIYFCGVLFLWFGSCSVFVAKLPRKAFSVWFVILCV